jgi:hypothetical protein
MFMDDHQRINGNDVEMWVKYPQYRWLFNKLEIALRLGYDAAPIMVPVTRPGKYIIRPIYNLYGMGIGAHAKHLNPDLAWSDHAVGPPGTFWCEYFEGNHLSVDYKWVDEGKGGIHSHWEPYSVMLGEYIEEDLERFASWTRIAAPLHVYNVPEWIPTDIGLLNVEWRGESLIEVHIRSGNDIMHEKPLGTVIRPLWEGDPVPDDVFHLPNEESGRYDASGYLRSNRVGYTMQKKYPDW